MCESFFCVIGFISCVFLFVVIFLMLEFFFQYLLSDWIIRKILFAFSFVMVYLGFYIYSHLRVFLCRTVLAEICILLGLHDICPGSFGFQSLCLEVSYNSGPSAFICYFPFYLNFLQVRKVSYDFVEDMFLSFELGIFVHFYSYHSQV